MSLGGVELVTRLVAAGLSMYLGSYTLAAAADPGTWLVTGIFAFILYLSMRKKMLKLFPPSTDTVGGKS